MNLVNLTNRWYCLVDLRGNWKLQPRILLYYRRRAPGELRPFRFAVRREEPDAQAHEASRSEMRIALARLVCDGCGLCGTIAEELACQCGARIETYPLRRQTRDYRLNTLSQTRVCTVRDD